MDRVIVIKKGTLVEGDRFVEYIGRPSVLGNIYRNRDRDWNCDAHEALVRRQWHAALKGNMSSRVKRIIELSQMVADGKSIALECFCAPRRCHGDFLKQIIDWYSGVLSEKQKR